MGVDCLGTLSHNLHNKLCCNVHEARNGDRFRVHKMELMLRESGCEQ